MHISEKNTIKRPKQSVVNIEIPKDIDALSDIERNMLNALLAGVNTLHPSLYYELLTNEDEPNIKFREIGINFYDFNRLIAEVYCAESVSGITGEYQVTTFGEHGCMEIMLLSDAVHKIINTKQLLSKEQT
jgi:hypothetical protein